MSWEEVKHDKKGYVKVRKGDIKSLHGLAKKANDDPQAQGYIELNLDDLGGLGGSGGGPHTHSEYAKKSHDHDEYLTDLPDHDHPHTHDEYLTALPDHDHPEYEGGNVNGQSNSTIFYQNNNLNIYRDGVAGSPSRKGWQGWNYKSAGDSTKINWYIHDGNPEALTGQVNSIAFLVIPETAGTRLPHLTIYTMPQRDGQNAKPTYRSRITYENTETSELKKNQPYVVYYGQDPKIFENYPRVELTKADYTSQGPQGDDETIQSIVVSSDSGATDGAYNFTLQQSQIDFTDYAESLVFLAPITEDHTHDEFDDLKAKVEDLETRLARLES